MSVADLQAQQLIAQVSEACVRWTKAAQNPDGGLPSDKEGSRSCAWTTAGLLWAVACAGASLQEPPFKRAMAWVLENINEDGGIPIVTKGDHSIADATAQTVIACRLYLEDVACEWTNNKMLACVNWLLRKRLTGAGWNWRPSSEPSRTASTAFSLLALQAAKPLFSHLSPEITDAQREAFAWIRRTQQISGGWGTHQDDSAQAAITGLICSLLSRTVEAFDREKAAHFLRGTFLSSTGWPDTFDRPNGHTVTRIGNAYCISGLLELNAAEPSDLAPFLQIILSAFEIPRFRYRNSEMFSWPTRDYLLAICALGNHCGLPGFRFPGAVARRQEIDIPSQRELVTLSTNQLKIMTSKRFVHILHISDIHRASNAPSSNASLVGKLFDDIDVGYRKDNQSLAADEAPMARPDLIVVSGDFTQHGTDLEFEMALDFINELLQLVDGNPSRVVLIPGNHDVNWQLASQAFSPATEHDYVNQPKFNEPYTLLVKRAPDGSFWRKDPFLYETRLKPFKEFFDSFYARDFRFSLDRTQMFSIHDFSAEFGTVITGFNSCDEIDGYSRHGALHSLDRRAFINTDAIYRAALQMKQRESPQAITKIAVFHHNIRSINHAEDFLEPKYLQILKLQGFTLCLHGHAHVDSYDLFDASTKNVLPVIGAGSLASPYSERPPAVPMGYNLLAIEKATNRIWVHTRCHDENNLTWAPRYQTGGKSFHFISQK